MLAYLKYHHIALIALFVALGGTSYAATQLPSNSVGTRQIRAGAVTAQKIQTGAITVAYGYYPMPQPCISQHGVACPVQLIVATKLGPAANVSLADPGAASGHGYVCLALKGGTDLTHLVVVAAPTGGPNGTPAPAVDHAEWIPSAPNCTHGQLEVDTYYMTVDGSGQHITRTGLPFVFAIF